MVIGLLESNSLVCFACVSYISQKVGDERPDVQGKKGQWYWAVQDNKAIYSWKAEKKDKILCK